MWPRRRPNLPAVCASLDGPTRLITGATSKAQIGLKPAGSLECVRPLACRRADGAPSGVKSTTRVAKRKRRAGWRVLLRNGAGAFKLMAPLERSFGLLLRRSSRNEARPVCWHSLNSFASHFSLVCSPSRFSVARRKVSARWGAKLRAAHTSARALARALWSVRACRRRRRGAVGARHHHRSLEASGGGGGGGGGGAHNVTFVRGQESPRAKHKATSGWPAEVPLEAANKVGALWLAGWLLGRPSRAHKELAPRRANSMPQIPALSVGREQISPHDSLSRPARRASGRARISTEWARPDFAHATGRRVAAASNKSQELAELFGVSKRNFAPRMRICGPHTLTHTLKALACADCVSGRFRLAAGSHFMRSPC